MPLLWSFDNDDDDSSGSNSQPSSPTPASGQFVPLGSQSSDTDIDFGLDDLPVPAPEPSDYDCSSQGDQSDLDFEDLESDEASADASQRASGQSSPAPHSEDEVYLPSDAAEQGTQESEAKVQQSSEATRSETPENQPGGSNLGLKTTPVVAKPSTTHSNSVSTYKAENLVLLRREYASEMKGHICQIDIETFMEEFVPGPDLPSDLPTVREFDRNKFNGGIEAPLYDELCGVANSVFSHVCDSAGGQTFVAKDTHLWGDPTDKHDEGSDRCPDVIVYPMNEDAAKAYTIEGSALTRKTKEDRERCEQKEARTAWHQASLVIEVKIRPTDSPFVLPRRVKKTTGPSGRAQQAPTPDAPGTTISSTASAPDEPALKSSRTASTPPAPATAESSNDTSPVFLRLHDDGGVETMGQLTEYTSKVLRRGSRLFVFSIFVCREHAWLLRWDRAGLVVSKRFNLLEEPRILHKFLYRFAHMTDEQRGQDPTVAFASKEDVKRLRAFSNIDTDWQKKAFEKTLGSGWPMYKILIPEEHIIRPADLQPGSDASTASARDRTKSGGEKMYELLVGMPHFKSDSVTGRGTKCYLAYDVAGERLVLCKEYWRVDVPTSHPEGEVYERLHRHGVNNIPTPIAAGDACIGANGAFCTRSQEFLADSPPKLILYRLVMKEIGEPLENYEDSLQLVEALGFCMFAHQQAWEAGVLHRDISENNILIYRFYENGVFRWRALLVDWAFCKYRDELGDAVVRKARSGTWQFISAVLLFYPGRFQHAVWHDLESFIHVLHRMCLRFHKTDYVELPMLRQRVSSLYDFSFKREDGVSKGGHVKLEVMQKGIIPFALEGGSAVGETNGLHRLLTRLAKLYKEHYASLGPLEPSKLQPSSPLPDAAQTGTAPRRAKGDAKPVLKGGNALRDWEMQQAVAPAAAKPRAVLADHTMILELFMEVDQRTWKCDKKIEDRFAQLKKFQEEHEKESQQVSKRSSDGSSDRPEKRSRRSTRSKTVTVSNTSPLPSIGEGTVR